jgi:hypothetical protein
MDPSYMCGGPYKNFGEDKTWANPQLQSELAKTYNYNVNVGLMGVVGSAGKTGALSELDELLFGVADSNNFGVDTIFQRMGAKYCATYHQNATLNTGCETAWRFTNQTLPDSCYLQAALAQGGTVIPRCCGLPLTVIA